MNEMKYLCLFIFTHVSGERSKNNTRRRVRFLLGYSETDLLRIIDAFSC